MYEYILAEHATDTPCTGNRTHTVCGYNNILCGPKSATQRNTDELLVAGNTAK